MLIQKGANVNTNVITIPGPASASGTEEGEENSAQKWRLRSSITPPAKPTCEPVFKVMISDKNRKKY